MSKKNKSKVNKLSDKEYEEYINNLSSGKTLNIPEEEKFNKD